MADIFIDALRDTILITGLVTVMMLLIEYININSHGSTFEKLKSSSFKQVLTGAFLGLIPGCIGGFAAVSLYTHRMLSFGALVAMMIVSTGDEAFIMLTLIPKTAVILFAVLLCIGIIAGLIIDRFSKKEIAPFEAGKHFKLHDHCCGSHSGETHPHHHHDCGCDNDNQNGYGDGGIFSKSICANFKNISRVRVLIMAGIFLFIVAIVFGILEHSHEHDAHTHFDIFSERWLNLLFAIISLVTLFLTAKANEHFIKEHLWNHVIKRHLLKIFLWTLGALTAIHIGLQYLDIDSWMSENIYLLILLAAVIGLIPESGPHMIFIAFFANGMVPFSVLLTSSIVQDGHTTLPLLAESKMSFVKAKLINLIIGIAIGITFQLISTYIW